MDGAVTLARRSRHDSHTSIQQILTGHIQIGMTPTEYPGEQALQAAINLVEGLFEAGSRFFVDLPDRILQRRQRSFQIVVLLIEINLALGLGLILVDCSQIDRTEALDPIAEFFQRSFTLLLRHFLRKLLNHFFQFEVCFLQLFNQAVALDRGSLGFESVMHQSLTQRILMFLFLVPLLLKFAHGMFVLIHARLGRT